MIECARRTETEVKIKVSYKLLSTDVHHQRVIYKALKV